MKRMVFLFVAIAMMAGVISATAPVFGQADREVAPIYGVKLPPGYRVVSIKGRISL